MGIELLERQVDDWKHQSAANSQFAVVVLPYCNVDEDERWKRVSKKILNIEYQTLLKILNTKILNTSNIVNNKTFLNTKKQYANTSKQYRNTSKQRMNTSKQGSNTSKHFANMS